MHGQIERQNDLDSRARVSEWASDEEKNGNINCLCLIAHRFDCVLVSVLVTHRIWLLYIVQIKNLMNDRLNHCCYADRFRFYLWLWNDSHEFIRATHKMYLFESETKINKTDQNAFDNRSFIEIALKADLRSNEDYTIKWEAIARICYSMHVSKYIIYYDVDYELFRYRIQHFGINTKKYQFFSCCCGIVSGTKCHRKMDHKFHTMRF